MSRLYKHNKEIDTDLDLAHERINEVDSKMKDLDQVQFLTTGGEPSPNAIEEKKLYIDKKNKHVYIKVDKEVWQII